MWSPVLLLLTGLAAQITPGAGSWSEPGWVRVCTFTDERCSVPDNSPYARSLCQETLESGEFTNGSLCDHSVWSCFEGAALDLSTHPCTPRDCYEEDGVYLKIVCSDGGSAVAAAAAAMVSSDSAQERAVVRRETDNYTEHSAFGNLLFDKYAGGTVYAMAWSPDGRYIAMGPFTGGKHALQVWDAEKNFGMVADRIAHTGSINSIAWKPTGELLVTASSDNSVKLWDTKDNMYAEVDSSAPAKSKIEAVVWGGQTHDMLFSGSTDGRVRRYRVVNRQLELVQTIGFRRPLRDTDKPVDSPVDYSATQKEISDSQCKHCNKVYALASQKNSDAIAVGTETGVAFILLPGADADYAKVDATVDAGSNTNKPGSRWTAIWTLVWSPDGSHFVVGTSNRKIIVYDVADGYTRLKTLIPEEIDEQAHSDVLRSLSFRPDGAILASGSKNYQVKLWDVSNNYSEFKIPNTKKSLLVLPATEVRNHVYSVAWRPDGNVIAAATDFIPSTSKIGGNVLFWSGSEEVSCPSGSSLVTPGDDAGPDGQKCVICQEGTFQAKFFPPESSDCVLQPNCGQGTKYYQTTGAERTCSSCVARKGQYQPLSEHKLGTCEVSPSCGKNEFFVGSLVEKGKCSVCSDGTSQSRSNHWEAACIETTTTASQTTTTASQTITVTTVTTITTVTTVTTATSVTTATTATTAMSGSGDANADMEPTVAAGGESTPERTTQPSEVGLATTADIVRTTQGDVFAESSVDANTTKKSSSGKKSSGTMGIAVGVVVSLVVIAIIVGLAAYIRQAKGHLDPDAYGTKSTTYAEASQHEDTAIGGYGSDDGGGQFGGGGGYTGEGGYGDDGGYDDHDNYGKPRSESRV